MIQEKGRNPISVSVELQLHHYISSENEVCKGDIAISSEKELSVLDKGEDGSTRLIRVMFGNTETRCLEVDVDRFAVSPDGQYLLIAVENVLLFFNYHTYEVIEEMNYPSDCQITYIKWINQSIAALVSTKGLLLFDTSNRSEMIIFASYASGIKAEDIVDVHVDLVSNYYLLQVDNGELGQIQIGRFNSESLVLDGLTGCLARLESVYMTGLYAILFTKKAGTDQDFMFHVLPLEGEEVGHQPVKPVAIQIAGLNKTNRPERILTDNRRCLAYVVFANGFLHIWDFGLDKAHRLLASQLASTTILDAQPCTDGGFLSAWAGDDRLIRIHLHGDALLASLYAQRRYDPARILHLAVRLGLPNTTLPALRQLVGVIATAGQQQQGQPQGREVGIEAAIKPFVEAGVCANSSHVSRRFARSLQSQLDLAEFIYSELRSARGAVDWLQRVGMFLGQYEDMDARSVASVMDRTGVETSMGNAPSPTSPAACQQTRPGDHDWSVQQQPVQQQQQQPIQQQQPVQQQPVQQRSRQYIPGSSRSPFGRHPISRQQDGGKQDEESARLSLFASASASICGQVGLRRDSVLLTSVRLAPLQTTVNAGNARAQAIRNSWRASLNQMVAKEIGEGEGEGDMRSNTSNGNDPIGGYRNGNSGGEEGDGANKNTMHPSLPLPLPGQFTSQLPSGLPASSTHTEPTVARPPSAHRLYSGRWREDPRGKGGEGNAMSLGMRAASPTRSGPERFGRPSTAPSAGGMTSQPSSQLSSHSALSPSKPSPLSLPPIRSSYYNPAMTLVRPSQVQQQQVQQQQVQQPSPPRTPSHSPNPSLIPTINTSKQDNTALQLLQLPQPAVLPSFTAQDYQILGLLSQIPSSRKQYRDEALVSLLFGCYEDEEERKRAFQGIAAMLGDVSIDPSRLSGE